MMGSELPNRFLAGGTALKDSTEQLRLIIMYLIYFAHKENVISLRKIRRSSITDLVSIYDRIFHNSNEFAISIITGEIIKNDEDIILKTPIREIKWEVQVCRYPELFFPRYCVAIFNLLFYTNPNKYDGTIGLRINNYLTTTPTIFFPLNSAIHDGVTINNLIVLQYTVEEDSHGSQDRKLSAAIMSRRTTCRMKPDFDSLPKIMQKQIKCVDRILNGDPITPSPSNRKRFTINGVMLAILIASVIILPMVFKYNAFAFIDHRFLFPHLSFHMSLGIGIPSTIISFSITVIVALRIFIPTRCQSDLFKKIRPGDSEAKIFLYKVIGAHNYDFEEYKESKSEEETQEQ